MKPKHQISTSSERAKGPCPGTRLSSYRLRGAPGAIREGRHWHPARTFEELVSRWGIINTNNILQVYLDYDILLAKVCEIEFAELLALLGQKTSQGKVGTTYKRTYLTIL
jgi:hypothetical protein